MSWPLIIGITAAVVATDLYTQKIKKDAKNEEQNQLFNFENKLPSIEKKEDVTLPDEVKKVKVKKMTK